MTLELIDECIRTSAEQLEEAYTEEAPGFELAFYRKTLAYWKNEKEKKLTEHAKKFNVAGEKKPFGGEF